MQRRSIAGDIAWPCLVTLIAVAGCAPAVVSRSVFAVTWPQACGQPVRSGNTSTCGYKAGSQTHTVAAQLTNVVEKADFDTSNPQAAVHALVAEAATDIINQRNQTAYGLRVVEARHVPMPVAGLPGVAAACERLTTTVSDDGRSRPSELRTAWTLKFQEAVCSALEPDATMTLAVATFSERYAPALGDRTDPAVAAAGDRFVRSIRLVPRGN